MTKISTPSGITIIVVIAFIIGGGVLAYQYWWLPKQETPPQESPSIKVLSPNGGENISLGQSNKISWSFSGDTSQVNEIALWLFRNDQQIGWVTPQFGNISPITNSYVWDGYYTNSASQTRKPSAIGDGYKILIIAYGTLDKEIARDKSDAPFSIVASQTAILYKTEWNGASLYGRLYKSKDSGKTWKEILSQYKGKIIYATDSKNPNIIYAGDTGGNLMAESMDVDLLKSTDAGEHWIDISKRITDQVGALYGIDSLRVDSNDSNIVKVTVKIQGESINFKSLDGGNTWTKEVAPSITVLSPNGEEAWEVGKTYNITWNTNKLNLDDIVGIILEAKTANLPKGTGIAIADSKNTGSYNWTIPTTVNPGQYYIYLYVYGTVFPGGGQKVNDFSDAPFSIK